MKAAGYKSIVGVAPKKDHGAPPANPSFGITMTKILKEMLRHATQLQRIMPI